MVPERSLLAMLLSTTHETAGVMETGEKEEGIDTESL